MTGLRPNRSLTGPYTRGEPAKPTMKALRVSPTVPGETEKAEAMCGTPDSAMSVPRAASPLKRATKARNPNELGSSFRTMSPLWVEIAVG